MKYRCRKIMPGLLIGACLLSGCATKTAPTETPFGESSPNVQTIEKQTNTEDASASVSGTVMEEYFSARDLSADIDSTGAVEVKLNGTQILADSDSVSITGSTVTIKKEGVYILSGTLKNGSVIVDAAKEEKVQLVLNGVSIQSDTFAAIYVKQADKVFVTLAEGTENALVNDGSFTQIDDNNVDAVIFSKDDITFNGTGSLSIQSLAGHGIVGKDEVTITGGTYEISSSKVAIRANDSIAIADGTFKLNAETDGLHAEKSEDESLGSIYIAGGTFDITAGDDGIHATTTLQVDGGSFHIQAAEGMEATVITLNNGDISIEASDDGINAAKKSSLYSPKITVNGGNISVVMGAGDTDGFDANGDIEINGGTIQVTGNSTFDYDGTGVINGGTVTVNGQQITTLSNQMMGGHGGMGGGKGGMSGGRPDMGGMVKGDKAGMKEMRPYTQGQS